MTERPAARYTHGEVRGGPLDGAAAHVVQFDVPPALLVMVPRPAPDGDAPGGFVDASITSPAGYPLELVVEMLEAVTASVRARLEQQRRAAGS